MIVFETKIQFAQNQKHSLLLQYRCAFQIKPFRTSAKTAYPSHGAVFHCSNVDGDITSLAILFGFLEWRHSCGLLVLVRHHGKALSLQSRHVVIVKVCHYFPIKRRMKIHDFRTPDMARTSKSLLLVNIKSMILRNVSVHLWCLFWFWLIC